MIENSALKMNDGNSLEKNISPESKNLNLLKEIGIPDNKLRNVEHSLNDGHSIEKNDNGNTQEIIPLNFSENSYGQLMKEGFFDDSESKTYLVNEDFYKQPEDVIKSIEDQVYADGGEIKVFNYKDKEFSSEKYLDSNGNPKFSDEGTFADVVKNAPNDVGVYVHYLDGKPVYVGRAIEARPEQSTSGLNKRLSEHYRGDANGKPELFANKDNITTKIIVCDTVSDAKQLEGVLIKKFDTVENGWNKRNEA